MATEQDKDEGLICFSYTKGFSACCFGYFGLVLISLNILQLNYYNKISYLEQLFGHYWIKGLTLSAPWIDRSVKFLSCQ